MTDLVLGLVPVYGLFLIFGVTFLACLAVPLPASMLVLASGSFAASEDLVYWQVLAATFAAFALGDQVAFRLSAWGGPRVVSRLRSNRRAAAVIAKSEQLLDRRGRLAVLLSRTVLSPTGPYVSYLCGAGGMRWLPFTTAALVGASVWTSSYVSLGYVFADQLTQVADILSDLFGVVMMGVVVIVCLSWLRKRWHAAHGS